MFAFVFTLVVDCLWCNRFVLGFGLCFGWFIVDWCLRIVRRCEDLLNSVDRIFYFLILFYTYLTLIDCDWDLLFGSFVIGFCRLLRLVCLVGSEFVCLVVYYRLLMLLVLLVTVCLFCFPVWVNLFSLFWYLFGFTMLFGLVFVYVFCF